MGKDIYRKVRRAKDVARRLSESKKVVLSYLKKEAALLKDSPPTVWDTDKPVRISRELFLAAMDFFPYIKGMVFVKGVAWFTYK